VSRRLVACGYCPAWLVTTRPSSELAEFVQITENFDADRLIDSAADPFNAGGAKQADWPNDPSPYSSGISRFCRRYRRR
jgi:hypothetical protein